MKRIAFISLGFLFLLFSCNQKNELEHLSNQIQNDSLAIKYFKTIKETGKLVNLVKYEDYIKLRGQAGVCETSLEMFQGNQKMYELAKSTCEILRLGKEFKSKYPITKSLSDDEKRVVYGSLLKSGSLTPEEIQERIKLVSNN